MPVTTVRDAAAPRRRRATRAGRTPAARTPGCCLRVGVGRDRTASCWPRLADWFDRHAAHRSAHPRRRLDRRPDRPPADPQGHVPGRRRRPRDGGPRRCSGSACRRRARHRRVDPRRTARATSIATVVASTATVLIWVIALLLVLGELGIDLAPLIAGAGIAGVALGFGAQNLVKDCLAGLFMLIEDQYGIGDVVDLGEATGAVEQITLRTTVLRGQDGTVWHVPNGEIRPRRQPLAAVVGRRARRRRRLRRRPRPRPAARARRGDPACASPRTSPATCSRRRSCSASRRWRPTGVTLRLLVKTAPGRPVPAAAGAARGDQGRSTRRRRRPPPPAAAPPTAAMPPAIGADRSPCHDGRAWRHDRRVQRDDRR